MNPYPSRRATELRPSPPWTGPLGGALMLLVVAGGAWFLFTGTGPLPIDKWWYGQVQVGSGSLGDIFSVALARIGGSIGAAVCFAIAVAALLSVRRRSDALAVALAGLLGVVSSETLKAIVQRPRPPEKLFPTLGFSYPSGHSTAAAALSVSLLLVVLGTRDLDIRIRRVAAIVAIVWVLTMMWSRTALHVHWLSDTAAGAALGISAALIARALCVPARGTRTRS
jgi:membrane-associated phospholipid phosphatase